MIRLKNVCKSYGNQQVLDSFDLEIRDGEHIAVMGRSGIGKTTAVNIILGLVKPDSGSVDVPKGKRIGVVFQEDRLLSHLSAVGNISVAVQEKDTEKVLSLLADLKLDTELCYKPVSELSGGERRRVSIARALLSDADTFIFDEPFKGIDEQTLELVITVVKRFTQGKALLMITHSKEEAALLCERIIDIV